MDEKFRHRLIGATVWIALAVIFLPIVFDGAGYRALHRADMGFSGDPDIEIKPSAPERHFKTTSEKLRLRSSNQSEEEPPESSNNQKPSPSSPASHKARQAPDLKTATAADNQAKDAAMAAPATAMNKPQEKTVGKKIARKNGEGQARTASKKSPSSAPHARKDKKEQGRPERETSGPWTVEAAAYNDQRGAAALIDYMRRAGYPARLKPVVAPAYTLFVVEIGPFERLDLLEEAQNYAAARRSIGDAVIQAES